MAVIISQNETLQSQLKSFQSDDGLNTLNQNEKNNYIQELEETIKDNCLIIKEQ